MKINEIFYSIQGEGYHTGQAAIFIRMAGCNLKCPFCDTDFSNYKEMTEDEIVREIESFPTKLVVITGGEPALQITSSLVDKLHGKGKYVAIETNGTKPLPNNIDWVTVSPKIPYVGSVGRIVIKRANELKVVFDVNNKIKDPTFGITASHYFVQPCDTGFIKSNQENYQYCVNFVKENPLWKISLQTQKILKVR